MPFWYQVIKQRMQMCCSPFKNATSAFRVRTFFLKQLSSTLGNFSSCVILFCFADNLARGGTESLLPLLSHSLGSQHAFSGASPKLLWIRHRQYYDIGESKQQLKRKWKQCWFRNSLRKTKKKTVFINPFLLTPNAMAHPNLKQRMVWNLPFM